MTECTGGWNRRGIALLIVLVIVTIVSIGIISTMGVVISGSRLESRRDSNRLLYYTGESGLQYGMYEVCANETPEGTFTSAAFPHLLVDGIDLTVIITGSGIENHWDVSSHATDSRTGMDKTLRVRIRRTVETVTHDEYDIPKIFDYIYFLNNWAWFWGDGITADGDSRSNGDFDLRSYPDVYGQLYAHGDIRGSAEGYASDPTYRHPGVDSLVMPNLHSDFSHYEALATANGSTVTMGGETLVNAVHSGDLYLHGTPENPVIVDGPVVITGNLIIEGYFTGQGSFYAGNNIYIADDLQYANGPSLNADGLPRPTNSDPSNPPSFSDRQAWVEANLNADLIAYAARESIFFGDVTDTAWAYPMSFLDDWGDESQVGPDGIPDTGDDGTPFYHDWDGDGLYEHSPWYDTDGDDQVDGNYTWSEVRGPIQDLSSFDNYPTDEFGNPVPYSSVASNGITQINGIFYTNRAFSGRSISGPNHISGAVITKDEAIIYSDRLYLSYDERIHSDFRDPANNVVDIIDLANLLPIVVIDQAVHRTEVVAWAEDEPLPPVNPETGG
ncbi:pilus assembly PilX N-terminal domain-containing protein [Candidatus Sumerlaeota bacterium]|nr:pilus assembly PilX N-terminal domain-containing protein [Candidatus Sumerlaeota bacterium]